MAADINFLPGDGRKKDEKPQQVRKIEYTRPQSDAPAHSPTKHGGIFSVFKKSEPEASTPETKKEQLVHEPVVQKPEEKKYVPPKVKMTVEKKLPEKKKERKSFFAWLRSLFTRSTKPLASKTWEAYQGKPPVPPDYEPKKVEASFDTHIMTPVANTPSPREVLETLQPPKPVPPPPPTSPLPPQKNESVTPPVYPTTPPVAQKPKETVRMPSDEEHKMTEAKVDAGPQTQGMSFDVNLVPEDLAERSRRLSRVSLLGLVIVVSIAFVGILYGALEVYRQNVTSKIQNLDKELIAARNQIVPLKQVQLDALALKKRTDEVRKLLDTQIFWSKFFLALEKNTLTTVTYSTLAADANGQVTLAAQAPSPEVAFEQLKVFQDDVTFVAEATMPQLPTIANPVPVQSSSPSAAIVGVPVITPTTPTPGTSGGNSSFTINLTLQPAFLFSTSTLGASSTKQTP